MRNWLAALQTQSSVSKMDVQITKDIAQTLQLADIDMGSVVSCATGAMGGDFKACSGLQEKAIATLVDYLKKLAKEHLGISLSEEQRHMALSLSQLLGSIRRQ